jgi:hypothetical protein
MSASQNPQNFITNGSDGPIELMLGQNLSVEVFSADGASSYVVAPTESESQPLVLLPGERMLTL